MRREILIVRLIRAQCNAHVRTVLQTKTYHILSELSTYILVDAARLRTPTVRYGLTMTLTIQASKCAAASSNFGNAF